MLALTPPKLPGLDAIFASQTSKGLLRLHVTRCNKLDLQRPVVNHSDTLQLTLRKATRWRRQGRDCKSA
eukprot:12915726-Prorocentrum_lima.AAC.1